MNTYFNLNEIKNADELKKAYRALCLTMHPDKGGNAEEFKAMKSEYDAIMVNFEVVKIEAEAREERERQRQEWEREEAERKAREAEEERKAAEAFTPIIEEWRERLEQVPEDGSYCDTKARAKYAAAVKRNLKAVFSYYFPGVSVNVSMSRDTYKEHVTITWTDGPAIYEVERLAVWSYFIARHWESDPYADYGSHAETKSTRAWRAVFGGILEECKFNREFSPAVQAATMAKAAEIIPDFAGKVWNDQIETTDEQAENLINLFGIRSPYQWRAGMTDEETREYYRLSEPFDELCKEIRRVIAPSHRVNWGNVCFQTITGIFERFYKLTDEDRAAAAKAEKEEKNAFKPQHGATYNAIVKLLGKYQFVTNPSERRAERQSLSIYEAVEILAAGGSVAVASVDVREDGQSLWIWCLSNGGVKTQQKRAEKWQKMAGLSLVISWNTYGAVIVEGVTPETLAAVRLDAADVEEQRKAWEARKDEPQTETKASNLEPAKDAETLTEAEAVEMIEKAEQAGTITRETSGDWFTFSGRGTFGLKKAFRALGGMWDKIEKVWRVPVCYYNQDPAFVTYDEPEKSHTEEPTAEAETEPQQEEATEPQTEERDPLAEELAAILRRADEIRAQMAERDAQRKADEERRAREAEKAAAIAQAREEMAAAEAAEAQAREAEKEAAARAQEIWEAAKKMSDEANAMYEAAINNTREAAKATRAAADYLAYLQAEDITEQPATPSDLEGVEEFAQMARRENVRQYFRKAAKVADELTEQNEHDAAAREMVAAFYVMAEKLEIEAKRHLEILGQIKEAHDERGHILPEEMERRTCSLYRCAFLCVEEFGEELARVLFGSYVDGLTCHPEATTAAA